MTTWPQIDPFWFGFLLFPVFWLIFKSIVRFLYRQRNAIIEWYLGIPVINWLGIGLIVLGLKLTSQKYVRSMISDNRIWFSPKTFVVEDAAGRRPNPDLV